MPVHVFVYSVLCSLERVKVSFVHCTQWFRTQHGGVQHVVEGNFSEYAYH